MPLYVFTSKDGRSSVEKFFTMASCPRRIRALKKWHYLDIGAMHRRTKATPGAWPMVSYSAGVSASQAVEAMEHAEKIGIPTQFTRDGDPVFTSREHRKRYCEAIGLFDRNGGYGDPQRRNRHVDHDGADHGGADIGV